MKRGKTGCRGKSATPSYRALAKSLRRSPSHIFRVMQGERKPNDTLRRRLARMGITCTVDGKEFEEGK